MIRLPLVTDDSDKAKPQYWRSLDELSDSASFRAEVAREFPEQAGLLEDPVRILI